jgi:hypothetical protein
MKLISFDIGIKNMAYCLFEISGSLISVLDWNVLNLIDSSLITINTCTCLNKPKNKKSLALCCNKKAKFVKGENFYCKKHAKTCGFIVPNKRFSTTSLKKLKNEELLRLFNEFKLQYNENMLKKDLLQTLVTFFETNCLNQIIIKKQKTASEIDLIYIGKKIKEMLNTIPIIQTVDYAILENQISPIANRMKTIQGMLAQYFIMINDNIHIEFISSSNKLKSHDNKAKEQEQQQPLENVLRENSKTTNYKQNKIDGVTKCSQILEKNIELMKWKNVLETKKKDDLADCFLQGYWYINKKIIK